MAPFRRCQQTKLSQARRTLLLARSPVVLPSKKRPFPNGLMDNSMKSEALISKRPRCATVVVQSCSARKFPTTKKGNRE